MFVFDVETLGKKSDAVILSMGCIYFDPKKKPTPEELRKTAFFVKLDANDQIKRLHRTITKSSVDWWAKQCENVRKKSFLPSKTDIKIEDGHEMMRAWSKSFAESKSAWVWARGNLDQLVLDDLEEQLSLDPVFTYNRWRDVRTAVDFLTNSSNGYCTVDYPGFDPDIHITKHDPVDDCIYDAMMLNYGVNSST
jgi:hypothetical protein